MGLKHNLKRFVKGDEDKLVDGLYLDRVLTFPDVISIETFRKEKLNEGTEDEEIVIASDGGSIYSFEYTWDESLGELPYGDFRGCCWHDLVYEDYEARIVPVSEIFNRFQELYLLAEYVPDEDVI